MNSERKQPDLLLNEVLDSVNLGIDYLYDHQLPNGEFCCYYSPDEPMQEWCVPDSTIFPASVIASNLLGLQNHSKANKIISSVVNFLQYQMMRGGVWNHHTKWNPLFKFCPADIDNTVYASYIFKSLHIEFPPNENAILNNRNSKGIFYTWFVIRPRFNAAFLRVAARELKYLLNTIIFWNKHDARRNDMDAVVNANALFYLGLNTKTQTIVDYLINVINNEVEIESDNWYKNPLILYYAVSRNYAKVVEFATVKDKIIERIYALYNENGSFGASEMDTALAISTLLNFKHEADLTTSISYLTKSQNSSGNWKRRILFYSGPSKVVGWGSEEIVTSYCIEALSSFYNSKNIKIEPFL